MKRGLLPATATPWLLLAPAMGAVALIVLAPVAQTVWLSLHRAILTRPRQRPFIGFDNYVALAQDPLFWESLGHSFVWVLGAVGSQFALGFAAALLLNRSFWWRAAARALVVVPWALPSVIIGLTWTWMLDFNLGIANEVLLRLGLLDAPVAWLARPDTAMPAVILALTWQGFEAVNLSGFCGGWRRLDLSGVALVGIGTA